MRITLALCALTFALAPAAYAQPNPNDVPDMPRPAEIVERVNELLDRAPEERVELDGVARIVYRRLPQDVHAVALAFGETLSGRQSPRGMDLDRYVRQFEPQIQKVLDDRLGDVGTIELLVPLRIKGKQVIPPGTYKLGLALQGGRLAAVLISGDDLQRGRPVPYKLKLRRPELDPAEHGAVVIELRAAEPARGGGGRFDLVAALRGQEGITSPSLEVGGGED
ncbi:MAG: hypothetical protein M9894_17790 [Planctomycetes bacterium]|nr:hypothetical protein [Planctomycetota bacterium]